MAFRRSSPLYLGLAALFGALAMALLRAATADHSAVLTAAMLRQSATHALGQLEASLVQEAEMARLSADSRVLVQGWLRPGAEPAAAADKAKPGKLPAGTGGFAAALLQQRGWLGLQRSDGAVLPGRQATAAAPIWPADAEGAARAEGFQQLVLSPLRPASGTLPAHLLLHVPLPVQDGGDVLTLVLPASFLAQQLRGQPHPEGLQHRLLDRDGQEVARRGQAPADAVALAGPLPASGASDGTGQEALRLVGALSGLQLVTELAGPAPDWLPQPSRLNLALALALSLALMVVCILAYKTRRGLVARQLLASTLAERAAERRLSDIAANLPGAIYRLVRSPKGEMSCTYMSEGVNLLLGEPAGSSPRHSLLRGLTLETRTAAEAALQHSANTLTPLLLEGDVLAADGRRLWLRSMASVHPLPDGSIVWDGVLLDSTEQRQAEERATLLAREVDHRAKNIMAVVRSLLLLTPRDVPPAQFVANLDGRLCALARAHDLLAGQGWAGAELEAVVRRELATYAAAEAAAVPPGPATLAPPQLVWQGPTTRLTPGSVQPVEMILHELATNAAKHGALSRPGGVVELRWTAVAQGGLLLDWRESGGPPVQGEPARQGFGFRLIHTLARHQLAGSATFLWSEAGLQCRIRLGAKSIAAVEAPAAPPPVGLPDTPIEIPAPPARAFV